MAILIASIFIVCSKPETYVCSTNFRGKLNDFINLGTHRKGQEQEIKLYVSPIMSKKKTNDAKLLTLIGI